MSIDNATQSEWDIACESWAKASVSEKIEAIKKNQTRKTVNAEDVIMQLLTFQEYCGYVRGSFIKASINKDYAAYDLFKEKIEYGYRSKDMPKL
jgi:hypothetical protein